MSESKNVRVDQAGANKYNDDYFFILSQYTADCLVSENELKVFQSCLNIAIHKLGFSDMVIYTIDEPGAQCLNRIVSHNSIEADTLVKVKIGEGVVGACAEQLRPVRINDVEEDPRYNYAGYPGKSEIAVPIMHDGALLGVIDSENVKKNYFTDHHEELLTAMANITAITILKLKRTKELEKINKNLETRVEEQTNVLQKALVELQRKNESLSLFSSTVSHDLKSPLRTISSFAELSIRNINKDEKKLTQYLSTISNVSTRAYHMVNEIMNYGKINEASIQKRKTDIIRDVLEPVYDDLAALIHQSRGCISILPGSPALYVDPTLIRLVFQNLLSNSLKFRKSDQIPEVKIEPVKINQGFVTYSIIDNGIGIDPMTKKRMFKPFHKGHNDKDGFGLGLATCMSIVKRHDCDLWLDDSYELGTALSLTLPVWQDDL